MVTQSLEPGNASKRKDMGFSVPTNSKIYRSFQRKKKGVYGKAREAREKKIGNKKPLSCALGQLQEKLSLTNISANSQQKRGRKGNSKFEKRKF